MASSRTSGRRTARGPFSHTGTAQPRSNMLVTTLFLLSDGLTEYFEKKFKKRTIVKQYVYSPLVAEHMCIPDVVEQLNVQRIDLFLDCTIKYNGDLVKLFYSSPIWSFDRNHLVLDRVSGEEQPSNLNMHYGVFWVRIYDIPLMLGLEMITKKIRKVLSVFEEMDKNKGHRNGRFMRIKVTLDLNKPLEKGTMTPTRPTHKAGKGISRRIESVASQKEIPGRKLKKAELGIAVIHTYIWYMYVTLMRGTELCNRFNFIAASRINTTFITKNPTSVKNELVDRFMAADDNTTPSLYFLPFNSGNGGHWVLVAMDLSRLMVYYLDSLSGDWSKYPSMKKTVDA
ncbi:hypothetical protein KIW84_070090 [Lathyrus oleraceus]|uniref:Ubiquitin-like protease family profile domain-containing protein n=1 Tax=Pisum sativum TaxID=3888 RepID=A0A9D4ZRF2_PEA|nr:hypothetical protein KIW84_070090 [Pisum sativum]